MGDVNYIQVSEVMTRRPVVISSGSDVVDAAALMARHSIGSLLIMDGREVKGIVTLEDMTYKVVAGAMDAKNLKVEDIMTTHLVFVLPTVDVGEAMELMNENNIKQLPVISEGELVGFLTLKDILRIEPAMIDLTIERVRLQENNRQQHVQTLFDKEGLDIDEDLFE